MTGLHAADMGRSGRDLPALGVCGYSPVPSDPTVPLCNAPAVLHVLPRDGEAALGEASWTLMACTTHADLTLPQAIDVHPVTSHCLQPRRRWVRGSAWRLSGCAIPREVQP